MILHQWMENWFQFYASIADSTGVGLFFFFYLHPAIIAKYAL